MYAYKQQFQNIINTLNRVKIMFELRGRMREQFPRKDVYFQFFLHVKSIKNELSFLLGIKHPTKIY